jgi:hypothetical protein
MLKTIEGVYRNGQVVLTESPADVGDDTPVLVTFLQAGEIDLQARGMSEQDAAELRARLASFGEDWDSPEMSDYDDYETNRRKLETR